jgi:hypothetical protein
LSARDYRSELAALARRDAKAHRAVESVARHPKSVAQIRAALSRFADDERRLGDDVAKLKPPKDAESANDLLARGLHDTAEELRAIIPKLASVHSPGAALSLLQREASKVKGGHELDRALTELKAKGYGSGE